MTPGSGLGAVVWDMDGVIVDSGPYHFQAWQEVFSRRGVSFTEADFRRNFGQRNDAIIRNNIGREVSADEIETIAREKEESFRRRLQPGLKAFPGVIRLMKALHEEQIKMAIASSAPRENIDMIIRGLRIKRYIDAVVWGDEVTEGKPSPLGFLLAAVKLQVAPPRCVVIEDAVAGVTAARWAGMKCLAVTNTHPAGSFLEADLVVPTLEEADVALLRGLYLGR